MVQGMALAGSTSTGSTWPSRQSTTAVFEVPKSIPQATAIAHPPRSCRCNGGDIPLSQAAG
jgi:hypothetical protein